MQEAHMIGQKRTRFSVSLLIAAALLLMGYSLFAPARAMAVVRHALSVFAASVLPSLALFSVCAKILVKADAVRLLRALPLGGFLRMIGVSRGGFAAFLIGAFTGFPTGASVLAELCEKGEIDPREASSLLPFCNQAGAAFVMGTVGEALFHERRLGILLFAAQTLSAFLGLCLTAGKRHAFLAETRREREKKTAMPPFTVLTSSIAETAGAMLSVCGFIVFFSLCTEALSDALALVGLSRFAFLRALAGGLLEISAGFLALSETDISADAIAVLGGFFLGFGGISVFLQALDRTERFFFSPADYFLGKGISAVLCPLESLLLFALSQGEKSLICHLFFCLTQIFTAILLTNVIFGREGKEKFKFFSKKCGKIERNAV